MMHRDKQSPRTLAAGFDTTQNKNMSTQYGNVVDTLAWSRFVKSMGVIARVIKVLLTPACGQTMFRS